jgi:branched-chain amino acid transport system permease protein
VSDRRRLLVRVLTIGVVALLLWLPLYAEAFWLQTGLFAMSAAIGAIGLQLLVGVTGQLSLAHAFYLAVGAYGYCFLAGGDQPAVLHAPSGLGLPTWLAMVGAVLFAGVLGALFSPIAGRLRGIYLGLASIGLVFIGQHVLFNAKGVTGGFNGRDAEPFSLFGFSFSNSDPDNLVVFGVPYGGLERLWYLGLLLVGISWWYAHNVTHSRPGRALLTIRDSPIAAAVMAVNVPVYRAAAFTVSAMYAGLAGVLLALAFGRIVPDSFGFLLSIDFLVMIVVGGLGSVGGAVAGALLVSALPQIFDHYSGSLPLMGDPGGGGLQPAEAARYVYGAAVVAVLIFAPDGLSALGRRLAGRRRAAPPLLRTDSKERTA